MPAPDGQGRAVAVELLTVTPPVEKLLREQRVGEMYDLMRASKDPAQRTFNTSLLDLFRKGAITFEIGRAWATNPDEFSLQAEGMAVGTATFGAVDVSGTELDMKALLQMVLDRNASDLHLTVDRPPILRITGSLVQVSDRPLSDGDMRTLLFSILSGRQRSQYELEREIDFALSLENGRRFRVNAYFQRGRMAASLRAIPSAVPDPKVLGVPDAVLALAENPGAPARLWTDRIRQVDDAGVPGRPDQLLAVLPDHHSRGSNRVRARGTAGVHRSARSVRRHAELRGGAEVQLLRQDPDVILVGEMRDLETIQSALTAAETGHLVMATLHTNDSIQAIDRMIDVFPSHQQAQIRSQVASALLAVVSQRLLPRADEPGRIAAFEVLVATPAIRTLIRDGKMHQALSMLETSRKDGMVTMDRALTDLYAAGKISKDDAARYCRNPKVILGG